MRDETCREVFQACCNDDLQAFVQHRDAATLDASCRLMPLLGMISPTDPTWISTLDTALDAADVRH